MRVFWQPEKVTEGLTTTGMVMTLPSGITKEMAREMVEAIPMDEIIFVLAAQAARNLGTQLLNRGLRPADYTTLHDIPDVMAERIIDALAKKPQKFFDTFAEHLKMQG